MKQHILTGTCAALGLFTATLLGAQTTTTQPQTPSPSASASASAEKTVTVTGCLRAAPSSPASASTTDASAPSATASAAGTTTAGTTGTSGSTTAGTTGTTGTTPSAPAAAADASQKFVLEDAGVAAADAGTTSTAGAASATTPPVQTGQKETYNLVANPTALSPHVGKKLELTGTLEANSQSSSDTASGPNAGRPTLRVQSGRIVAASCDQK